MFSRPRAPKSSQNIGIYDSLRCFRKNQKMKRSQNAALFATLGQHNMSEMLYFTVFFERLLKDTGIYSVLWKHMHERP